MSSYSVSQGASSIEISSDAPGFSQNSSNRYYLNSGNSSARSDSYVITFDDGASIKLTDFNEIPFFSGSSSSESVIGIPGASEGGFSNSFNIIGGYGYLSSFDIYDNTNGLLLLDDYTPQTGSTYFQPYAQFGYSSGSLTIQAPRGRRSGSASIDSLGAGDFDSGPTSYVGGVAGTAVNQYTSGGSSNPWIFTLTGHAAPVCFAKNTLITMKDGNESPIETLSIGDLVVTSEGVLPIKWVGRRTVHRQNTPAQKYQESLPVRIKAGALGANSPHLDLLVSDSHGICVDNKIVNACFLINDLNIRKDHSDLYPNEVIYFHLEFEEEVLLLANGVKTCSYVNTGNRRSFDNYPEFISTHINPDQSVKSVFSGSRARNPHCMDKRAELEDLGRQLS